MMIRYRFASLNFSHTRYMMSFADTSINPLT